MPTRHYTGSTGSFQRLIAPFGHDAMVPQCAPEFDRPWACTCGRCEPGSNNAGKRPLTTWAEPPPESEIDRWAARWESSSSSVNWGVHLGRARLIAVDVDQRHGGWDTLRALEAEHGALPPTPRDRSAGGGRHYFLRAPAGFDVGRAAADLGPGVEALAGNHLVTVPPSVGPSGRWYLWDVAPWRVPFHPAPAWVLLALERSAPKVAPPDPRQARYATMARTALADRTAEQARAYLRCVPTATTGQGGYKATIAAVVKFCARFDLPDEEALALLREWNAGCSPPWPPGQLQAKYRWARERVRAEERPAFGRQARKPTPTRGWPLSAPDPDAKQDSFPELSRYHHARAIGRPDPPAPQNENAATAELLRLRHHAYPCANPRTVLTKSVNWKTGQRTLNLIDPRCDAWSCPACCLLHKEEWQTNYRLRLLVESDPKATAYAAEVPIGQQKLYTDRIHRKGGRYFFLSLPHDFDTRLIVSDRPFKGCTETTNTEAAGWLCRAVEGYDGKSGKPGGGCRAWKLPKPPASDTSAHVCLGVCPGGLTDDAADQVVARDFLSVQGIQVPASRRFLVLRWRTIQVPDAWSYGRIDKLAARLVAASTGPFKTARDQPYRKPNTDRVGHAPAKCYAGAWCPDDIPE